MTFTSKGCILSTRNKIGNEMLNEVQLINLKEIVRVISSDPPCKDGNVRFTTVPLKALSGQE